MTTPDEPTRASGTGWPSDGGTTTPPVTSAETDSLPAEPAPAVDTDPLPLADEPAPIEPAALPVADEPAPIEPDPLHASDPVSVDPAPVVGRSEVTKPTRVDAAPTYAVDQPVEAGEPPYVQTVDEPATPRSVSPWRSAAVLALLIMTVLMTAATAVVWYQVHRHDQTEDARRQGVETSRDAARVLFSYDYRTLAKDFAAGKAITTGKFRNDYANTTSKVVTPVATEKKAVVKAEVVTAGVVRATTDTVVTIVYVNQVTTSSLQSGPKVDLSRVRMTVKRVGSQWLISNVEAL